MSADWSTWNQGIVSADRTVIEEFRAHAGQVGGYFAGAPLLLLHHIGVRAPRAGPPGLRRPPDEDETGDPDGPPDQVG